jgi:tetratricopeptide (TPR) repeat protein
MTMSRTKPRLVLWLPIAWMYLAISFAQSGGDFDRGLSEFRASNYAKAAKLFASAESSSPGTTDALLYEAKSLIHLPDLSGAEKTLRSYLGSHRDSSDALYLLGLVLNQQNRPVESLEIYTRAAALIRPTADDLKIVGLDYVLLDDYPDAIKWLEKAVRFDPTNADAWYYLGRAYYTKSRLIEAQKAFQKVLELNFHDARAENNLGLILESDAKPDAAIEDYRKAIAWQEQSPRPSEQPYVNLGNLLMEQGRTEEAIGPLEKAVALAPDNAFCRLKLGIVYLRAQQLEGAQRELEKATQLEPDNAAAHYQLGKLYKAIHAPDRAKAEFERTAELQSRAASAQSEPANH